MKKKKKSPPFRMCAYTFAPGCVHKQGACLLTCYVVLLGVHSPAFSFFSCKAPFCFNDAFVQFKIYIFLTLHSQFISIPVVQCCCCFKERYLLVLVPSTMFCKFLLYFCSKAFFFFFLAHRMWVAGCLIVLARPFCV